MDDGEREGAPARAAKLRNRHRGGVRSLGRPVPPEHEAWARDYCGEAIGLSWDAVDLEAGRVSLTRALVAVGYEPEFSEPKTDFSGLPPGLMWLRQYLAVTESARPVTSLDGEDWLNALPRSLHGSLCWAQEAR